MQKASGKFILLASGLLLAGCMVEETGFYDPRDVPPPPHRAMQANPEPVKKYVPARNTAVTTTSDAAPAAKATGDAASATKSADDMPMIQSKPAANTNSPSITVPPTM